LFSFRLGLPFYVRRKQYANEDSNEMHHECK
jgi:hypothetical protein